VKPDDEEETDLAKAPSRIPDPEVNEGAGRDVGGAEPGRRHTGRDDESRQEGWDEEPEGQAKAIAGGPAEVAALEDCPERQKGMDDERAVEEHAADRLRQAARNPVGDPHPRPRRTRAGARDPGSVLTYARRTRPGPSRRRLIPIAGTGSVIRAGRRGAGPDRPLGSRSEWSSGPSATTASSSPSWRRAFLADCPHRREDLSRALAAGDARELRRSAHMLAGALASLGAMPGHRLAADLERLGAEARLEAAPEACTRLEAELDCLVRFVENPGWMEST